MSLSVSIKKYFKDFTLQVAFEQNGNMLGVLGASGGGKSMTLKCIAGIEKPDEGRIVLNGHVLFDSETKINKKPQERKVGYLFQNYALFPNMTVEENIAASLSYLKRGKQQKIEEMIRRFQLQGLEKRFPMQLSGGQQQRTALARILAYEPEVIMLDEPFSALDFYLREKLQTELKDLLKGYQGDVILVTHSRDEAYRLCDQLLVLDRGQTVARGDTKEMFRNPQLLSVAQLTGCKNFSRTKILDKNHIEAIDWGIVLQTAESIPSDSDYIGIRAHDFRPAQAEEKNAFPIAVVEKIESPFGWDIVFQTKEQGPKIWWQFSKESSMAKENLPQYLSIAPERILLLRSCGHSL